MKYIENKWIILKRNSLKNIVALTIFQINNNKLNYNFILNIEKNPINFLNLHYYIYDIMKKKNIIKGILWIDINKEEVIKMNNLVGWVKTDLQSNYYLK